MLFDRGIVEALLRERASEFPGERKAARHD